MLSIRLLVFIDVHVTSMNTVVDLMERYCLNFGKTLRHIRDEGDPRQPIEVTLMPTSLKKPRDKTAVAFVHGAGMPLFCLFNLF